MSTQATDFEKFNQHFSAIEALEGAAALLHWDAATMMPRNSQASASRGAQQAALAGLWHKQLLAPEIAAFLANPPPPEPWAQAFWAQELALRRHQVTRAAPVRAQELEAAAYAQQACAQAWRVACRDNDFALVMQPLETLLSHLRTIAERQAAALGCAGAYDALLDVHQPGLTWARVESLFAPLAEVLPGMIRRASQRSQAQQVAQLPALSPSQQDQLARRLIIGLGFDGAAGRIDHTAHPFCGGTRHDVRIGLRVHNPDSLSAIMAAIHEGGHALYEQGLPPLPQGFQVAQACGLVIHESQSLFFDMHLARTPAFLTWVAREWQALFAAQPLEPAQLSELLKRVTPGLIRVDADEITYPAHILLRTKLERALLEGTLAIRDLPEAWNQEMQTLLGLAVPDARQGVLQDIHWYDGAWGYFPCYTLGAMASAQIMAAAQAAGVVHDHEIKEGNFARLRGWLRHNIHSQGSQVDCDQLLRQATGKPLEAESLITHLRARYQA